MNPNDFWEQADQVTRFAQRESDRRLLQLLSGFPQPSQIRVLDIGCAAGRNTVVLAERGFDFYAADTSFAMVERTRERVTPIVGANEARQRVKVLDMQDLSVFASESYHLIVALGVFHNARNGEQWYQTLSETARLLCPDGQLLVSNFSPRSNPHGKQVQPVVGQPHVYRGFSSGRLYLLDAKELDAEMARFRLVPLIATETVQVKTDGGQRVTVNGHYRKSKR
jgi:SAM-dependent methyltransferase